MDITIKTTEPKDFDQVIKVISLAFKPIPYSNHDEDEIVNRLAQAGDLSVDLVAMAGDLVVGFVAASPVTIAGERCDWYGLGPVAVLPEYQRQGIGQQLIEKSLKDLVLMDAEGCVVVGEPAYYQRFGFKTSAMIYYPGTPEGYFMSLLFKQNSKKGVVRYHDAFYQ